MAYKINHGMHDNGDDGIDEVHDINVTPFIDVILVLLIIFMVAAPLSTVDVAVDLPAASAAPQPRETKPIFLTIKADRTLAVGEEVVARASLAAALGQAMGADKGQRIYLQADKSLTYGEVIDVMNELRASGFLKVALVALEKPAGP